MKRKSAVAYTCLALGAIALLGCKHVESKNGAAAQTNVAIAKQACEINALAEERDALISSFETKDPDKAPYSSDRRRTILSEKLQKYSAEVEASYRFVTANCNSYNLCMENTGYSEAACDRSRLAWIESHAKFNALAERLASMRRESGGGGAGNGRNCGEECRTQGGVFSTDCCH